VRGMKAYWSTSNPAQRSQRCPGVARKSPVSGRDPTRGEEREL
jgi:hypothetical protein